MKYFIYLSLMVCISCSTVEKGLLITNDALPEKGFNFPYYLFVPNNTSPDGEVVLIVEPNNSGFVSDDFYEHLEKAQRIATKDFYIGNYLADELKFPLLVPVFPRTRSEWQIYTHSLDRDAALQKDNSLERIDLQLIAMIEDAKNQLRQQGFTVNEQILMAGFSASGTFANRFTAIHPDLVMAMAAGGVNGLLILPVEEINGISLNYPLGVHDFSNLFGKPFSEHAFCNTPQFLYMGQLDDNDAIPFEDGYSLEERTLVFDLLGEEMQPTRWNKCTQIYKNKNVRAESKTYKDIGHEHPETIKKDILNFFKKNLE